MTGKLLWAELADVDNDTAVERAQDRQLGLGVCYARGQLLELLQYRTYLERIESVRNHEQFRFYSHGSEQ